MPMSLSMALTRSRMLHMTPYANAFPISYSLQVVNLLVIPDDPYGCGWHIEMHPYGSSSVLESAYGRLAYRCFLQYSRRSHPRQFSSSTALVSTIFPVVQSLTSFNKLVGSYVVTSSLELWFLNPHLQSINTKTLHVLPTG